MKNAGIPLFFCLIFAVAKAFGQDLGEVPYDIIPKATIHVTSETVSPSWQLIWDDARKMVRDNELDGALALYRELLKDRPGLVEARWELTSILMRLNRDGQALRELEHVIEARPNDIQLLFTLIELLSRSGQCDRAIAVYKRLLTELNYPQKALVYKKNQLAHIPGEMSLARIQEKLGICLDSQKRYSKAVSFFSKALSSEPHRKDLELKLACGLVHAKKAKESLAHFQSLLPQYENDPDFLANYAKALLAVGDPDKAIKMFEKLSALLIKDFKQDHSNRFMDDLSWIVGELVRLYLMDGDVQSAINLLEKMTLDRPAVLDQQHLATLGRLYFASKNYFKTIDTFRALLKRKPDDVEGLLFLARAYERLQLIAPAISIYNSIYHLQPDQDVSMHLVELLLQAEDFDSARTLVAGDLRSALEGSITGRWLLLRACLGSEEPEGIDEELLDEAGDFLGHEDVLVSYVSFATSNGFLSNQVNIRLYGNALLALTDQGEGRRTLLQSGVKMLLDLGQGDLAEKILRQCWAEGRSLWSTEMLLDIYSGENKLDKAVKWIDKALSVYPSSARLKLAQARLLLNMGKAGEVRKLLYSVRIGTNWGQEKILLCRGHTNSISGRYENALGIYGEIIQQASNHLEAHRGRWIVLHAYGLRHDAQAEALGLLGMITGELHAFHRAEGRIKCSGLSHNGCDGEFIDRISTDGKLIPAPGYFLSGLVRTEELPSPKEILNSPLCGAEGEACPLLLALSYEQSECFSEAIVMWFSFLKRHQTYWPGYERLGRIFEGRGQSKRAKDLCYRACKKIRQMRESLGHGEGIYKQSGGPHMPVLVLPEKIDKTGFADKSEITQEGGLEMHGPMDRFMWQKLDHMALESWEAVFCSE